MVAVAESTSRTRIGRYELVEPIASGGMATVHLARVTGPGGFKKLFALKTIHPHLVSEDGFVEMFLDEARLASRITHPNVCQIVDFGVGTGSYYIAMELLVGLPLDDLRTALSNWRTEAGVAVAVRIAADAARGLHRAHTATNDEGAPLNVVHRDISQANLFVTFDGVTKVLDFGIASAADQLHLTRTGTIKGKFAYMAPEQLEQEPVDRRADIWALGVVLWELVTGQRLFRHAKQVDTIRAVLASPVPLPSSVAPAVPASLDAVICKALSRDPEERFASAQDFADALAEVQRDPRYHASVDDVATALREGCPDQIRTQSERIARARSGEKTAGGASSGRSSSQAPTETQPAVVARAPREKKRTGGAWKIWVGVVAAAGLAYAAGSAGRPTSSAESVETARPPTTSEPPSSSPAVEAGPQAEQLPPPREEVQEPERPTTSAAQTTMTAVGMRVDATEEEPPSAPEPRVTAMTARGYINVTTPGGWADVYVGGRRRGRSTLRIRVPAGRRRVSLRPFGRGSVSKTVQVRSRQVTRLVVPVQSP